MINGESMQVFYDAFRKSPNGKTDEALRAEIKHRVSRQYNGDVASIEGIAEFGEMLASVVNEVLYDDDAARRNFTLFPVVIQPGE